MDKIWKVKDSAEVAIHPSFAKYHPLILTLLANRGITDSLEVDNFFALNYTRDVLDPFLFTEMEKAVERIYEAKEKGEKIAIYGDYDADGVTATVLLSEALESLGFSEIIVYIPDRQLEGYGINIPAIEYLRKKEVKLIITVDCGITNVTEVERARELGIEVIITDHHHVLCEIPKALAIISAKMKESKYTFRDLSGVGIAFKLAQALYQKMNPGKIDQLKWFLDLVAIGTIADCVSLKGENRALVKYGLIVLSKTKRIGLQEMFKVGRIGIDENNPPDTRKVAFLIAPRVNASGRMDHASIAYKLMMEKDRVMARDMALEVEAKNQERQKLTSEITCRVRALAEKNFENKKVIFAHDEHWPIGVLGLVAGRITDEFHKPAVILQKQKNEFAGSLRSIPEVNIIRSLELCADLLIKFGGHSQAAGVKLSAENLGVFQEKFSGIVEKKLLDIELSPAIEIDAELPSSDISRDLCEAIKKMEPFGEGNEEPMFLVSRMKICEVRMVGNGMKHLKLSLTSLDNNPKIFDSIGFGMGGRFQHLKKDDIVDIVCTLNEDEWNGNKKIQLKLVDLKICKTE